MGPRSTNYTSRRLGLTLLSTVLFGRRRIHRYFAHLKIIATHHELYEARSNRDFKRLDQGLLSIAVSLRLQQANRFV